MTLTRNLYELDEVVSSLMLMIRKNSVERAHFWMLELLVSEEPQLAFQTITDAWLLWGGGYDPTLITTSPQTITDWSRILQRVAIACNSAKSLNAQRFINATSEMETRPTGTPQLMRPERLSGASLFQAGLSLHESIAPTEARAFWASLADACCAGKRTDAIWLLQAVSETLSADAIWAALHLIVRLYEDAAILTPIISLLQATASPHPLIQLKYQVNALLILCENSETRRAMVEPQRPATAYYESRLQEWAKHTGRRAGRIHKVLDEAIHRGTTRGQMPAAHTNIHELRNPLQHFPAGCQFWKKTLDPTWVRITGSLEFANDHAHEMYYEEYFPDDIPDEWSLADQLKSHGPGMLEHAGPDPTTITILSERIFLDGISMARLHL